MIPFGTLQAVGGLLLSRLWLVACGPLKILGVFVTEYTLARECGHDGMLTKDEKYGRMFRL